eukprot:CAMPEP_0202874428 /NCGR_PEP_ID=MMETSP1391-20130828/25413_1 /ASSEMBLY_ACC=CAM_ASM_000867 /TAXON_ID=1034604 /ORGANISM="Chlamydomonas leiostraca, Strain SAG 11-49" /LENGTH=168 /DNA_ID=CAMNT_0049555873 /DNA_START=108 /DNA_END=615 /DNA_ORIENTATION=-
MRAPASSFQPGIYGARTTCCAAPYPRGLARGFVAVAGQNLIDGCSCVCRTVLRLHHDHAEVEHLEINGLQHQQLRTLHVQAEKVKSGDACLGQQRHQRLAGDGWQGIDRLERDIWEPLLPEALGHELVDAVDGRVPSPVHQVVHSGWLLAHGCVDAKVVRPIPCQLRV